MTAWVRSVNIFTYPSRWDPVSARIKSFAAAYGPNAAQPARGQLGPVPHTWTTLQAAPPAWAHAASKGPPSGAAPAGDLSSDVVAPVVVTGNPWVDFPQAVIGIDHPEIGGVELVYHGGAAVMAWLMHVRAKTELGPGLGLERVVDGYNLGFRHDGGIDEDLGVGGDAWWAVEQFANGRLAQTVRAVAFSSLSGASTVLRGDEVADSSVSSLDGMQSVRMRHVGLRGLIDDERRFDELLSTGGPGAAQAAWSEDFEVPSLSSTMLAVSAWRKWGQMPRRFKWTPEQRALAELQRVGEKVESINERVSKLFAEGSFVGRTKDGFTRDLKKLDKKLDKVVKSREHPNFDMVEMIWHGAPIGHLVARDPSLSRRGIGWATADRLGPSHLDVEPTEATSDIDLASLPGQPTLLRELDESYSASPLPPPLGLPARILVPRDGRPAGWPVATVHARDRLKVGDPDEPLTSDIVEWLDTPELRKMTREIKAWRLETYKDTPHGGLDLDGTSVSPIVAVTELEEMVAWCDKYLVERGGPVQGLDWTLSVISEGVRDGPFFGGKSAPSVLDFSLWSTIQAAGASGGPGGVALRSLDARSDYGRWYDAVSRAHAQVWRDLHSAVHSKESKGSSQTKNKARKAKAKAK